MLIFLLGKESGAKPDFRMILCPSSLARKEANPVPKPALPWQFIKYKSLVNG